MPVLITQTTNVNEGEVSATDRNNMTQSFVDKVELYPQNGLSRVVKKYSVAIMKDEFSDLINHYSNNGGIDAIKISFAIHPNEFTACNGEDLSQSLTVIIEAAKLNIGEQGQSLVAYDGENDFVLIPAYHGKASGSDGGRTPCCPSSNP